MFSCWLLHAVASSALWQRFDAISANDSLQPTCHDVPCPNSTLPAVYQHQCCCSWLTCLLCLFTCGLSCVRVHLPYHKLNLASAHNHLNPAVLETLEHWRTYTPNIPPAGRKSNGKRKKPSAPSKPAAGSAHVGEVPLADTQCGVFYQCWADQGQVWCERLPDELQNELLNRNRCIVS